MSNHILKSRLLMNINYCGFWVTNGPSEKPGHANVQLTATELESSNIIERAVGMGSVLHTMVRSCIYSLHSLLRFKTCISNQRVKSL